MFVIYKALSKDFRQGCMDKLLLFSIYKTCCNYTTFSCISIEMIKIFKGRKNVCCITNTAILVQMITCAKTHETCKINEHFYIAVREFTQDCNIIQYNTANNE